MAEKKFASSKERLEYYRSLRHTVTRQVVGTTEQRNSENERVLEEFRPEREATNALIANELDPFED